MPSCSYCKQRGHNRTCCLQLQTEKVTKSTAEVEALEMAMHELLKALDIAKARLAEETERQDELKKRKPDDDEFEKVEKETDENRK